MASEPLIPHLFRTEYRKIVSVLCKRFGFDEIEIAEDIASDTFLTAAQTWGLDGVPPNPTAWLYTVAKNKAINHLQRNHTFETTIVPELSGVLFCAVGTYVPTVTRLCVRRKLLTPPLQRRN